MAPLTRNAKNSAKKEINYKDGNSVKDINANGRIKYANLQPRPGYFKIKVSFQKIFCSLYASKLNTSFYPTYEHCTQP
jgi:hypothetical protein